MSPTRIIVLAAMALLVSTAGSVFAGEEEYQMHRQRARMLVRRGDLRGAIRACEEAYSASPRPEALFNLGLIYRQLADEHNQVEDASRAIESFGHYIDRWRAVHSADPPDVITVERYMAELRVRFQLIAPVAAVAPTGDSPKDPTPTPIEPPRAPAPSMKVDPIVGSPPPARVAARISPRIPLGFSLVGIGVAAATAGVVCTSLGFAQQDGDKSGTLDRYYSTLSTLRDERQAGIALLATGGAALAAGVVALAISPRRERSAALYVSPSWMGIQAGGAF